MLSSSMPRSRSSGILTNLWRGSDSALSLSLSLSLSPTLPRAAGGPGSLDEVLRAPRTRSKNSTGAVGCEGGEGERSRGDDGEGRKLGEECVRGRRLRRVVVGALDCAMMRWGWVPCTAWARCLFSGGFGFMTACSLLMRCGVVRRTFKFEPVARGTQEDSGRGLAGAGDNRRGTCLFQERNLRCRRGLDRRTKGAHELGISSYQKAKVFRGFCHIESYDICIKH